MTLSVIRGGDVECRQRLMICSSTGALRPLEGRSALIASASALFVKRRSSIQCLSSLRKISQLESCAAIVGGPLVSVPVSDAGACRGFRPV